jgi:acetone carboxylase gamma subunit
MTTNPLIPERVERCRKALVGYSDDDRFTSLIDLLADAMHWSDAAGENFHYALCVAGKHYLAELNDEPTEQRRMP